MFDCGCGIEAELGNRLFAHHKLLDLAGDGHREGIDELDVGRHLEMGDPVATELLDLRLRSSRSVVTQLNPRHDLLAVLDIGHPDHLHVGDRIVGVEVFLDLARIHVLAHRE